MKILLGPCRTTASLGDIVSLAKSIFPKYISSFTFQFFRSRQNLVMSFSKLSSWLWLPSVILFYTPEVNYYRSIVVMFEINFLDLFRYKPLLKFCL